MNNPGPGFSGGVGFAPRSAPDDDNNLFDQHHGDYRSANPDDDELIEHDEEAKGHSASDGFHNNGGNDFWGQDFGGQNNNMGRGDEDDEGVDIDDEPFGGQGKSHQMQMVEVKEKKPKIGEAFEAPLTPEEQARVAEIENDQRARMQRLQDKEANEIAEK